MGFPSPSTDYLEERIDLNSILIKHPLSTFIFRSEGNAMKDAFIPARSVLVVDRSITAKNGDIVVAVLNGEFTVRYLKQNANRCWLVPANRQYRDIEITEGMQFELWGVVVSIIINPAEATCML